MTEYLALARKYRPRALAELIGQEPIARTLANAMALGRLSHAYIFCGTRGTGKTTVARILARALNCDGGPTATPCGTCPQCTAILDDRHMDVIEMDAASQSGVENIRELIDGVNYAPVQGRYKIYIIDEVHMLSKSAFNALLKTLEEPPAHAKFFFATTEPRRIPPTILSRCQRFDLRRVDADRLAAHFTSIAGQEGRALEADAAQMLARAAEGSVRDGLSLLDQALANANDTVDAGLVRSMLGLPERAQSAALLLDALAGKSGEAITGFRQLLAKGSEPASIMSDLLELVHALELLALAPETIDAAELGAAAEPLAIAAKTLAPGAIQKAWSTLIKGLPELREAPNQRRAAEMLLFALAA